MSNGLDFERQVHALLKNMGFEAEITKASGDGGIDIIAHSKEHITGGKYIIQCKDWSKPVGEPPVRDLYGVVTAENANKGILITTSTFTAPAINFAAGKPLELIDGTKFNQLLSKYSLVGIEGEASSTADDERIKVLTEQLDRNPKNILVMKELADIYLLQVDYNRAAELYETIIPLKPTVETERLNNAYTGGLNNYGVALAKLNRYDEALKIFQQTSYSGCLEEASLTHYLELFDIATYLYQKVKAYTNSPAYDEAIERAYLQMPLEYPTLTATISKDGQDEYIPIRLETAQKKAFEEGKHEICATFESKYSEIHADFVDYWQELASKVENDLFPDELSSLIHRHVELMNRSCPEVIFIYGHLADLFSVDNPLQEANRQVIIFRIEALKFIHDALKKFNDTMHNTQSHESWIELKNILWTSILTTASDIVTINQREDIIIERLNEEYAKAVGRWETIINQEKAEWREKLRNTLYKDWSTK